MFIITSIILIISIVYYLSKAYQNYQYFTISNKSILNITNP